MQLDTNKYIGCTFGKWTVVEFSHRKLMERYGFYLYYYKCRCKCGNESVIALTNLKGKLSTGCKSCGHTKHGNTSHPLYSTWSAMIQRCNSETSKAYSDYGGRGIKVCKKWQGKNGFKNFLKDMGEKPSPDLSLDRINNDGDYKPSNCRWADKFVQANNKRKNTKLTPSRIAELTGYSRECIRQYIEQGKRGRMQFKQFMIPVFSDKRKQYDLKPEIVGYLRQRRKSYLKRQQKYQQAV